MKEFDWVILMSKHLSRNSIANSRRFMRSKVLPSTLKKVLYNARVKKLAKRFEKQGVGSTDFFKFAAEHNPQVRRLMEQKDDLNWRINKGVIEEKGSLEQKQRIKEFKRIQVELDKFAKTSTGLELYSRFMQDAVKQFREIGKDIFKLPDGVLMPGVAREHQEAVAARLAARRLRAKEKKK